MIALEKAETLSVHELDFGRLRTERPQTADVLIAILAAQVRRLSTHLAEALYVPADTRVRRRLLDMTVIYGEGEEVTVPLTQEELASLAGTSRATVNRVLREEEEYGTLTLPGAGRVWSMLPGCAAGRSVGLAHGPPVTGRATNPADSARSRFGSASSASPSWPRGCGARTRPCFPDPPQQAALEHVLHEPGPIHMRLLQSSEGIPVAAGQPLTLTSRYDNQFPHVRAMGLMLAYIAPDPRVTAPCGPIPSDVKAIGSATPGRSHAPRVPIPTYRYDADGQAVRAAVPSGASPTVADGDASVDVTDAGFSAGSLSIPLGGTVTWRFLGPQLHNLTLASGPEGFSSDRLVGGKTFTKQFTKPGTYQFFCELHPVGMIERVVVRS